MVFCEPHSPSGSVHKLQTYRSPRVARLWSRLNLTTYSFSCELDIDVGESVPNIQSNYEYELQIHGQEIFIHAVEEWGALAALSTLAQLRIGCHGQLPNCEIYDRPKHVWRGLMVDVARHFITMPTLLNCCDLMHHFKFNVLHLHLSDDQGFRFGSEQYPELVSAEHYSMEDLKRLIQYAADLGIRVVPEIDVPGHTSSWLIHHPEWGFGNVTKRELMEFGSHVHCLDPSNPSTVNAVLTVFEELANTFPDEYVHVGGDEVNSHFWDRSASVQSWAHARQFKNAKDIHAHFTLEVCNHLATFAKRPIVWDDALHEKLPRSVTVQAWRGLRAREASLAAGFPTIVSAPYYLDLHFSAGLHFSYSPEMTVQDWLATDADVASSPELAHVADGVRWHQDFGEFAEMSSINGGTVLGGEACLWSELVTDELFLNRIWTRVPAIAERLWCGHAGNDVADMYQRLWPLLQKLPDLGLPELANAQSIHPCSELIPLFEMLEPVKWYGRLLSMERVRARANGLDESNYERLYNQRTPLNRIVDRIPPESLATYQLMLSMKFGEDLSPWLISWQNQYCVFDKCVEKYPELEELRPASAALARLADVALGIAEYDPKLAGPFGEYLLPVAYNFANDSE